MMSRVVRLLQPEKQSARLFKKKTLKALHRKQERWSPTECMDIDHTMIIYEEFLNQFCDVDCTSSSERQVLHLQVELQVRRQNDLDMGAIERHYQEALAIGNERMRIMEETLTNTMRQSQQLKENRGRDRIFLFVCGMCAVLCALFLGFPLFVGVLDQ